jgi:hypothetical protein
MTDALIDTMVAFLRAMRQAEVDVFGRLDAEVRDRPIRAGDWSPKDHQAHLTAWKARQANRYAAAHLGEEPAQTPDGETDAINAELQAARADWSWDAIVQEADEVSERLIREVSVTDAATFERYETLIQGTFGNGPFHALQHFGWLQVDDIGADDGRITAFARQLVELTSAGGLPADATGTALYNVACYHALAGRLDEARPLLRDAFRLQPDLADWARQDPDLTALRGELEELAGGTTA